jgi:hypothetical protein
VLCAIRFGRAVHAVEPFASAIVSRVSCPHVEGIGLVHLRKPEPPGTRSLDLLSDWLTTCQYCVSSVRWNGRRRVTEGCRGGSACEGINDGARRNCSDAS